MSQFVLYFALGREHILDYANGYDHILFILALSAIYSLRNWKHILILVTAFTVGHSITLAMATLEVITLKSEWIELFIPITIFITAFSNILKREDVNLRPGISLNYGYALFFGLIHGLGFSYYLKSLLGKSHSIWEPLLAFNLGLELGQIIVVALFLIVSFLLVDLTGVNRRDWRIIVSSMIMGISLILIKDRIF